MQGAEGRRARKSLVAAGLCVVAGLGIQLLPLASGFLLALGLVMLLGPVPDRVGGVGPEPRAAQGWDGDRLRSVVRALDEPLFAVDGEGRMTLANPRACALLDLRPSQVDGLELARLLPEEDRERFRAMLHRVLLSAAPATLEDLEVSGRVFRVCAAPIREDDQGAVREVTVTLHDLTGQHELANLKDEFFSSVTHELRAPLTSIRSFAEILQSTSPEEGEVWHEFLDIIRTESERMARLVNELLDLSKLEAGMMPLEPGPVSLGEQVQLVRRLFEPLLRQKRLELDIRDSGDLPRAWADRDRVHQVLVNLVGNAVKFSPMGGRIRVAVLRLGSEVEVCVEDEGTGIPAVEQERIFSRYHQVRGEGYESREAKGSGLGLSICKLLIEAMGGRIRYEGSTSLGGACFRFSLPPEIPDRQPA